MIGGMKPHTGDVQLARHLLKLDGHDQISVMTFGLIAEDVTGALAELRLMASDTRTRLPVLHAWASPSREYDADQWLSYWERFELEMGLVGQPYVEVVHRKRGKGGRTASHAHRAYLRVTVEGRAIPARHTVPRQEKLSRIAEFMSGEPFTSGVYNNEVIAALRNENYAAVADAMVAAGLDYKRALPSVSAGERAASERASDLALDEVEARLWRVWTSKSAGRSLEAHLRAVDLRLAIGDTVPVIVTPAGNLVPLRRALGRIARRNGAVGPRKHDVEARLVGLDLVRAKDLPRAMDYFAGSFGVTGQALRRDTIIGVTAAHTPSSLEVAYESAPRAAVPKEAPKGSTRPMTLVPMIDLSNLTPEQEAALDRYREAMSSTKPTPVPIGNTPELEQDQEQDEEGRRAWRQWLRDEQARDRGAALISDDWRDAYKARLAQLPEELGGRLRWVERLEADRVRILLKGGGEVMTEPGRATTSVSNSASVAVIVAHAVAEQWQTATISGGTPEWQEAIVRAATRAGIGVANSKLLDFVVSERHRMAAEKLASGYFLAREQARATRSKRDMRAFFAAAELLAATLELEQVLNGRQMALLQQDLRQIENRRQREPRSGP